MCGIMQYTGIQHEEHFWVLSMNFKVHSLQYELSLITDILSVLDMWELINHSI